MSQGSTFPHVVLFDVMSTLVYDPFLEHIPGFFDLDLEELVAQKHPSAWQEFERGELDASQFRQKFFLDDREWDYEALVAMLRRHYRLIDGIGGILDELRESGVPMYALSNYPIWYEVIEEELELSRWLDWDFVSHRTGVRKPDSRAYLGAAHELEVEPWECLFVDDRGSNVRGAHEVGMPAVRFEGVADLREKLGRYGLLPSAYPDRRIEVVGAAVLEGDRCLVAQRSAEMDEPGKWEFPGGKIEEGEGPEEALRRELREELGIDVEVGRYVGRGCAGLGGAQTIQLDVYVVERRGGELECREHCAVQWCRAGELEGLAWAGADVPIVGDVVEVMRGV